MMASRTNKLSAILWYFVYTMMFLIPVISTIVLASVVESSNFANNKSDFEQQTRKPILKVTEECEYNGRTYNDGDKFDDNPMTNRTCHCKRGHVTCTTSNCQGRNNCKDNRTKKNATVNRNATFFVTPNASSTAEPNTTATIEATDEPLIDYSRRNVSLPNYKIFLDSLMEGIIRPMGRVPNATMAPLTWLKKSAGNRNATDIRETVTDHRSSTNENEPLKNESRQEPTLEAKVYNPLMPYPDEYPEEYQTIQNGPALVITRTTYTRIPDVTYTMVTTTTLPTYRKMEKAEEAFGQALFGDVLDDENLRTENVIDEETGAEATTMTTTGQYFDINVTKIDEKKIEKDESKAKKASDGETPNETNMSTTTNQYFDISVTKIDENEFSD